MLGRKGNKLKQKTKMYFIFFKIKTKRFSSSKECSFQKKITSFLLSLDLPTYISILYDLYYPIIQHWKPAYGLRKWFFNLTETCCQSCIKESLLMRSFQFPPSITIIYMLSYYFFVHPPLIIYTNIYRRRYGLSCIYFTIL